MNEVLKSLTERRSCRSYLPDPIPQEVLDQILEAGTYAATGMGKQSPIMIAVTDKAVRDERCRDGNRPGSLLRRSGRDHCACR